MKWVHAQRFFTKFLFDGALRFARVWHCPSLLIRSPLASPYGIFPLAPACMQIATKLCNHAMRAAIVPHYPTCLKHIPNLDLKCTLRGVLGWMTNFLQHTARIHMAYGVVRLCIKTTTLMLYNPVEILLLVTLPVVQYAIRPVAT